MNHGATSLPSVYLKPGELYIGDKPGRVITVLGSCVAATFFHRQSGMAAMCHALQPVCGQAACCPPDCSQKPRFADCIIQYMTACFMSAGIRPSHIEIKLFGGAVMTPADKPASARFAPVGQQNVQTAMQAMVVNGLALRVADVGGARGRKIIFDTREGTVMLKRLNRFQSIDTRAGRIAASPDHLNRKLEDRNDLFQG